MTATIAIFILWLVAMTLLWGQGKIVRYFNLVDKRTVLGSKETYQKLNKLMTAGDVSLYRHEFASEPSVTFRGTYEVAKSESAEISIRGKSLDKVVADAYAIVKKKGFLK